MTSSYSSVLEITLLCIPAPNPYSQYPTILSALQKVRASLASSVHPTYSRFYTCDEDPSLIYILGSWPNLEAHKDFLANDKLRDEILGPQEGLLKYVWGIHVIVNGENAMTISNLPLNAPIVAFERLFLENDVGNLVRYEELSMKMMDIVGEKTEGYGCFEHARLDTKEDEHESLRFSGWESRERREVWVQEVREDKVVRAVRGSCVGVEVVYLSDMEGRMQ